MPQRENLKVKTKLPHPATHYFFKIKTVQRWAFQFGFIYPYFPHPCPYPVILFQIFQRLSKFLGAR